MIRHVDLTNILGQSLWETNIYAASKAIYPFYGNRNLIIAKSTEFWSATLCGSDRAGSFGGKYSYHLQDRRVRTGRNQQQQAASGPGGMLSK
jgi:hypothetical protein